MSKVKLKEILTRKLSLTKPTFRLERIGTKLAGSVISETFMRKSDRRRLEMVWNALEDELGPMKAMHEVGTILTYTPEEWNVPLPDDAEYSFTSPKARR